MNIEYRLGTHADIEKLLTMMATFYEIDGYPFDKELTRENMVDFFDNSYLGRLWVFETGDQLAGYAVLSFDFSFEFKGRNGLLDEFYIDEPFRHKGIGTKALDFVLEEAKKLNLRAVHLEVERHNETARSLYSKFNFKDHNRFLLTRYIN